jgi:hypothetical protein
VDVVAERATAPPPYHAYATITGVFVGSLALAGSLARLLIAVLTRKANELER